MGSTFFLPFANKRPCKKARNEPTWIVYWESTSGLSRLGVWEMSPMGHCYLFDIATPQQTQNRAQSLKQNVRSPRFKKMMAGLITKARLIIRAFVLADIRIMLRRSDGSSCVIRWCSDCVPIGFPCVLLVSLCGRIGSEGIFRKFLQNPLAIWLASSSAHAFSNGWLLVSQLTQGQMPLGLKRSSGLSEGVRSGSRLKVYN